MGFAGVVSNIVIEGRRYPIPALLVAGCVLLFSFFSAVSLIGRAHSLCLTTHAGGFSRTGAVDFVSRIQQYAGTEGPPPDVVPACMHSVTGRRCIAMHMQPYGQRLYVGRMDRRPLTR